MEWCKIVGTEPFLCFNMGTGTLDEGIYLLNGHECNEANKPSTCMA